MGVMMFFLSRLLLVVVLIFVCIIIFNYFKNKARYNNPRNIVEAYAVLNRMHGLRTSGSADTTIALQEFHELLRVTKNFIPQSLLNQLLNIGDVCADLNTKFKGRNFVGDEKALVFFTLVNYVPSILTSYLSLPDHERREGTEATSIAASQMVTIFGTLSSFQKIETQRIIDDLKIHAQFVEDKFKEYDK